MTINRQQFLRHYAAVDSSKVVLEAEIAKRLIQQLDYMKIQPESILNISLYDSVELLLQQRFPEAEIITLSPAVAIYELGAAQPVDVIVSHLLLHWQNDVLGWLQALQALLKPRGLFLFSYLGPDTLQEISQAFAHCDTYPHRHAFMDMHDVGDLLLQAGFAEPVMNRENITLYYKSLNQLFQDLKNAGAQNVHLERQRGLLGKKHWQHMLETYQQLEGGRYPATFEVVFGHAWQPEQFNKIEDGEVLISIDAIKGRKSS